MRPVGRFNQHHLAEAEERGANPRVANTYCEAPTLQVDYLTRTLTLQPHNPASAPWGHDT